MQGCRAGDFGRGVPTRDTREGTTAIGLGRLLDFQRFNELVEKERNTVGDVDTITIGLDPSCSRFAAPVDQQGSVFDEKSM
jgi:hypothetical protein